MCYDCCNKSKRSDHTMNTNQTERPTIFNKDFFWMIFYGVVFVTLLHIGGLF